MGTQVTLRVPDGEFHGYLARPAKTNAPAVVVLHEVFGVNDDMRKHCDDLAANGFLALCPDLFWRHERDLDLNTWSDADWKKGLDLYAQYDRDQGVRDIAAVVRHAAELPSSSGKVGAMGYCLGGLMTYLLAARERIDAAVPFHGGETEKYLQEADRVSAPMQMHLGDQDEFIPSEAQAQIKRAFAGKPNVTIYTYPGCKHAFSRYSGTHYDAEAANLANQRTWKFFGEHLR